MNARTPLACIAMAIIALSLCHEAGAVDPNLTLDEYSHTVWKTGDDGLYGKPYAVTQSADGYLWVGTSAGLFRFDGVRFHFWGESEDGHSFHGPVTDLYSSADGSLWIGSINDGLARLKDRRLEMIGHNYGAFVTEDRAGVIWYTDYDFRTSELCSFGQDAVPHCQPAQHRCSIPISLGGAIWCTADAGLVRIDHGKQVFVPIAGMKPGTDAAGVMALVPDDHGGLYVGIEHNGPGLGLEQLRGNEFTPVRVGGLDGSRLLVTWLFKDREGALWIGTFEGLYRIYRGRVGHLPMQDRDAPAEDIAEDREGSIWVATGRGLERFSDKAVVDVNFGNTQGLGIDEVDGVTTSRDGTLWVGGFDTLLTLRPGNPIFTAPVRLAPNSQVSSMLEDHNGTMWIGVNDSLDTLEAHRLTPLTSVVGKSPGMVLSLAEDKAFNLWAVTHGPTRQVLKIDERSRRITQVVTLPAASRVAADPAGGVYVAALNGDIVHVDSAGKQRVYPHLDGRSARISHLLVTNEGTVYASTPFGLETLNNGALQAVNTHNGLPCDSVYETLVDHSGDIWLYTQCGLIRIPKYEILRWRRNMSAVLTVQIFDAEDGADAREVAFNGSVETPDGTLWFANEGLQKVDPRSVLLRNRPPPPVHIEQLAADGRQYPVYGPVNLPPLTRDIQIDYAGLSFIAPDKVQFRYKLEGFDQNWRDVGARRQAFYNTLPPGTYRFRVIAGTKGGAWNTVGDSLNFHLAPTFYQTLWFRLLCGAFAALLLWLIFQLRLRQLVAQVRARQSAQYAERERIARTLHDTLLQSVQGLIWRFSAAAEKMQGDPAERRDLQELLDRSDHVLAEARNSILDLREPGNRSLALAAEISALGKEAVGSSGIPLTVLTNGKPYELDPEAYENTVLIVREALLNAVRHAKAQSLEVQIDYLEHDLRIAVRDDGQGIAQDTLEHGRAGHWGLLGMRERTRSFHGRLRILSRSGAGTEIELVVPRVHTAK